MDREPTGCGYGLSRLQSTRDYQLIGQYLASSSTYLFVHWRKISSLFLDPMNNVYAAVE